MMGFLYPLMLPLLLLTVALGTSTGAAQSTCTSLTVRSVAFWFDRPYPCGYFAPANRNGSLRQHPWVAAEATAGGAGTTAAFVGIVGMAPNATNATIEGSVEYINGFEVNPSSSSRDSLDSRTRSFGAEPPQQLPFYLHSTAVVLKAVGGQLTRRSCRPCLQYVVALTVLRVPPPPTSGTSAADPGLGYLRPPYFGWGPANYTNGAVPPGAAVTAATWRPDATVADFIPVSTIDVALLPRFILNGTTPTLRPERPIADLIDGADGLMLDHISNWVGEYVHPIDSMPSYGSSVATWLLQSLLTVLFARDSLPAEDGVVAPVDDGNFTQLLINTVQIGADLANDFARGSTWPPNGGHTVGRIFSAMFASAVLGKSAWQQALRNGADGAWHETGAVQLRNTSWLDLDGANASEPNADAVFGMPGSASGYWNTLITGGGNRIVHDPYLLIDGGQRPGQSYQYCCVGKPYLYGGLFSRLMLHQPGASNRIADVYQSMWPPGGLERFMNYTVRWHDRGTLAQTDRCAPLQGICLGGGPLNGSACFSSGENSTTGFGSGRVAEHADCGGGEGQYCDYAVVRDLYEGVTYGHDAATGDCILDTNPADGLGRFPGLNHYQAKGGLYGNGYIEGFFDDMWTSPVLKDVSMVTTATSAPTTPDEGPATMVVETSNSNTSAAPNATATIPSATSLPSLPSSAPVPTPPPSQRLLDGMFRIRGANFSAFLGTVSQRGLLSRAVQYDLARLFAIHPSSVVVVNMVLGSLVVDFTVTTAATSLPRSDPSLLSTPVTAAELDSRVANVTTDVLGAWWLVDTAALYATAANDALAIDAASSQAVAVPPPGPPAAQPPSAADTSSDGCGAQCMFFFGVVAVGALLVVVAVFVVVRFATQASPHEASSKAPQVVHRDASGTDNHAAQGGEAAQQEPYSYEDGPYQYEDDQQQEYYGE